jgi:hypothetical protein
MILPSRRRMQRGPLCGSSPSQGTIRRTGGEDRESVDTP